MFSIKNNNLKSLSVGITTRAGGGKIGQYPMRKMGQPIPGTTVKPAAPTLKVVEAGKPPKASTRPKPFVVSKTLAASKTLNAAPSSGTLKPVAACKPLNIVKRCSAPKVMKTSGLLKTPAASKALDVAGAADTPKLPPGLRAPGSPKTYAEAVVACKPLNIVKRSSAPKALQAPSLSKTRSAVKVVDVDSKVLPRLQTPDISKTPIPRASAIEAVRRQINEQKQKAAEVTARKAKTKSEPLPSAKPKAATPARDATPPPAPVSRPKAEGITATATAAENAPPRSPARRPIPAIRKGGVRKPLAAVSKASVPSSPAHTDGGCSRHQRNSLSATARLSERALTRRNAIRIRDPILKPRSSAHVAVTKSSSAPLLGWAKTAAVVTRSKSGPIAVGKVIKPADADVKANLNGLQALNPGAPSDDGGAADTDADASSTNTASDANTTISTLVGSDENASVCTIAEVGDAVASINTLFASDKSSIVHESYAALPPFRIEIQDFDAPSDTFPAPCAQDSVPSLASFSFSSILDMFPTVPTDIPGPLTQDVHRQLVGMSPAFAANKIAADDNISSTSSTSSISSILDQFPIVPTFIPRPLPQIAHQRLAQMSSLFAADQPAADSVLADGNMSNSSSVSSISSILDQFPMVPTFIPHPLPQAAHAQLAGMSPASAVDKMAASNVLPDYALPDGSVSNAPSTASISAIPNPFPMVSTSIPRPLPQAVRQQLASISPASAADKPATDIAIAKPADPAPAPSAKPTDSTPFDILADPTPAYYDLVRTSIISLDGDAPVLDTPAAWKAAFDSVSLGGTTAVGSSVRSCGAKESVKAARGVKGWWRRVVGKK